MRSNCLFYAGWQWIRFGGWLLIRRSHGGRYPHFAQADHLPEDLPCRQYVAKDGVQSDLLFDGYVKTTIGNIKPPVVSGSVDWVLLLCLAIMLMGTIIPIMGIVFIIYRLI